MNLLNESSQIWLTTLWKPGTAENAFSEKNVNTVVTADVTEKRRLQSERKPEVCLPALLTTVKVNLYSNELDVLRCSL